MRFVILGAGGVGSTIGGRLHETGHDVLLVARGAHLEALQQQGLRLAMPDRVLTQQVPAAAIDDVRFQPGDVAIVATKQQDGGPLIDAVAASGLDVPVLCAQNGVEGERIALRRVERVYGVCVMLPASHLEPGRVAAAGAPWSGSLEVGRYPSGTDDLAEEVAEALRRSGFRSTARAEVMPWKYAKLLRNVGNAIEALGGRGDALYAGRGPAARELSHRARAEAEACFTAAGIRWTGDEEWDAHRAEHVQLRPVEGEDRGGGSTWQSVARGLGSVEADHLNGEIALLGRLHGIATPVNVLLQREVNALVRRGGRPGSVDLQELLDRAS